MSGISVKFTEWSSPEKVISASIITSVVASLTTCFSLSKTQEFSLPKNVVAFWLVTCSALIPNICAPALLQVIIVFSSFKVKTPLVIDCSILEL